MTAMNQNERKTLVAVQPFAVQDYDHSYYFISSVASQIVTEESLLREKKWLWCSYCFGVVRVSIEC